MDVDPDLSDSSESAGETSSPLPTKSKPAKFRRRWKGIALFQIKRLEASSTLAKFRRRWKRIALALTSIVLILAIGYYHRQSILQSFASFLIYESKLKSCDAIAVLGGGGWQRVEKAAELFQTGYAPDIVICLPIDAPPDIPYRDLIVLEGRICQAIFKLRSVPAERTHWSQEPFYSTYAEAAFLKKWMLENNRNSILIVSGLFQSRRAKWTMDRMFRGTGCEILIAPAPEEIYSASDWWTNEEGVVTVENEYLKNIYYLLRGLAGR
ncbi:MAG: YdcF family protein [Candidatus Omnitrophota bacterium]